jgi:hypothetical protein
MRNLGSRDISTTIVPTGLEKGRMFDYINMINRTTT